jgi:thioredoxin reductase (NADPH)
MSNTPRGFPLTRSRVQDVFPKLTPAQIRRVSAHGHMRALHAGEGLYEQGDIAVPFFVVVSDELEIMRPFGAAETLVTVFGPGQFTGEVNTISGRRTFFRVRASEPANVIELDRQHMLALMQTDTELGDIMMRAFILRRVELVVAGMGDVVLIGSMHSVGTLRIKEFLTRNGHPYSYIDLDHDPDVQNLLDSFSIDASEIPVMICRGQVVLRNPVASKSPTVSASTMQLNKRRYATLSSSGPAPRGWLQQYMVLQKGLAFWCWKRARLVARQVQVQE